MKLKHYINKFLCEFSYNHKRVSTLNLPEVFNIEVTNYCNLDCIMCPRRKMTRKLQHMDFELFKKIVDECKSVNRRVQLYNFGEPFLCPDIFRMIDYAANAEIKTVISTNGGVLTAEIAKKILESKLDVLILSFDGIKKGTYEKYRVPANFEKVKENFTRFLEMKTKMGSKKPYTIMQIIHMKDTESEINEFKNLWSPLCDEVDVRPFNTYANQVDGVKECSDNRFHEGGRRYPCKHLWKNVIVLANGDVVPCCVDYDGKIIFGNINSQTLKNMWNGEKIKSLRKMHLEGNYISVCKNCEEWFGHKQNVLFPVEFTLPKRFLEYLKRKHV